MWNQKAETVIFICASPTCRGCCCSSHCSRSHFPSSESDVAGAPPLSEVEGQGDPLSAHCPGTWAALPAQIPIPSLQSPSLPILVTLAEWVEWVPPRGGSPGTLEGERDRAACCSPERSRVDGRRCCRCSGPLSWASRLAGNGLQKSWRTNKKNFGNCFNLKAWGKGSFTTRSYSFHFLNTFLIVLKHTILMVKYIDMSHTYGRTSYCHRWWFLHLQ